MKIMLVCVGGASTGLIMTKMRKWATEHNVDIEVKAFGFGSVDRYYQDYDCILIGPQVAYKEKEIKEIVKDMPVEKINSLDYALANIENILKQVERMGIK